MVAFNASMWTNAELLEHEQPRQVVGTEKVARVRLTAVVANGDTYSTGGLPTVSTVAGVKHDIFQKTPVKSVHRILLLSGLELLVGGARRSYPVVPTWHAASQTWRLVVFRGGAAADLPLAELANNFDLGNGVPAPDNDTYTIDMEIAGS